MYIKRAVLDWLIPATLLALVASWFFAMHRPIAALIATLIGGAFLLIIGS